MGNQMHAYANTPIRYNPYQYLPLLKLLENIHSNMLITDEVGLGKTIEAGIIIDEYMHTSNRGNVLIICPAFLKTKWQDELSDKFYYSSYVFIGAKHVENDNRITILPVSQLSTYVNMNLQYDCNASLIIVDEAHYFRNDHSARYRYLKQIIDANNQATLVFMTATPVNNSLLDYSNINKLLKNHYPVLTTNTSKSQAYIELRKRKIHDLWIDLSDEEYEIYDQTDELDSFSGTIYRHIGAGCIFSLVKYAEKNISFDDDSIAEMKSILALDNDCDESEYNDSYFNLDAELPRIDTKISHLYQVIEKHPKEKIVIFAHYIETVLYLYDRLRKYFRYNQLNPENISYIYGNHVSENIDIRNKRNKFIDVKYWFDNGNKQKILVCSDACKEGVDLDVASVLVNYDLPFNPSIVEQRIGRIDRMSQQQDMTIYNFHVNNTYDDRLNAILNMKLRYISNVSKYGVGNPLNINSEDAYIIINKYIKYFENREYSNEDLSILRKVFTQIGVRAPRLDVEDEEQKSVIKEKYKQIVNRNQDKIINWLAKSDSPIEKEILEKQYNELDNRLGFSKIKDTITVKLDRNLKDEIIQMFDTSNDFYKLLPILKNIDIYEDTLEEYGERKILSRDDIKDQITINYQSPTLDNFIPYEIVKGWMKHD